MKVLRYTLVFLCFFVLVCNNSYVKANIKIEDPDVQYSEYCAQYELFLKSATIIQYTIKGRFMSR